MTTTTANAVDEMLGLLRAALLAAYPAMDVRWPGVPYPAAPAATAPHMRVTLRHTEGGQGSLACEHGARRWRRDGWIIVQCFAPLTAGSMVEANEMACTVRDAFQGAATQSGVWFRDATTNEVGPDASWYQVNASVKFNYDEVR